MSLFLYLLARSIAQKPIMKQARAENQTKQTHIHTQRKEEQGNLYHLDKNSNLQSAVIPTIMQQDKIYTYFLVRE
jgi:hypothetical protein